MKNKSQYSFSKLPIIIVLLVFVAVIVGVFYFLFERPSSITCGIVIERKDKADSVEMKLGFGDETKWIKVSKSLNIPDGLAYNVKIKGIVVTHIEACKAYTGKIYSRTNKLVMLDNKNYYFNKAPYFYEIKNGTLKTLKANDVIIGATNDKFIENNGKIAAVIINPPDIRYIRVGISNSNFSSYNHTRLIMHSTRGFLIQPASKEAFKSKSDYIEVLYKKGQMEVCTVNKSGDEYTQSDTLLNSSSRIIISALREKPIYIDSLKRSAYSYTPKYYGQLEFSLANNSIHLINEVDMESYLRFVVPSEMLSSGGIEGYKVQAVAARTYALSEMISGRFAKYGFHVDDTTNTQAYNSLPANDFCDKAITATAGEIITYHNKIIDAKYYSTSCGLGAPYNEVWYPDSLPNDTNPEPYLSFKNYSASHITDLSNNVDAANFLKDWTINSYDSNSPYFRWKYTISVKDLTRIVNQTIYKLYKKNPQNFKKKKFLGFYKQTVIPKDGIGNITDIDVSKRGRAGNVLELTISTDTGTYKITKDYNIRRIICDDNVEVTPLYGNPLKNPSPLPSSYYVIDKDLSSNNALKNINVYGGGYGHGAGMSQYGVIGLIRRNKSYKDILRIYYKNISLDNYSNIIPKILD